MKKTKFVKCGFEFTAALKASGKIKGNKLESDGDSTIDKVYETKGVISKYKWINKNFDSDSCGCEVSTPVVKSKSEVIKYFKQFESFVKTNNLTIDINKANCGLGGCHIHQDISYLPREKQVLLLQNIAIFLTNNPELNWGFNDVNDNVNANSLLAESTSKTDNNILSSICLPAEDLDYTFISTGILYHKVSIKPHSFFYNFRDDKSPFNVFLLNPLNTSLKKRFALRYNDEYETVELRIFDMPKNLKQHILHYDVASAIYQVCLENTMISDAPIEFIQFKKYKDYKFTVNQSIKRFNNVMNLLGIKESRTKEMIENIRTRYKWTKNNKKENYLL